MGGIAMLVFLQGLTLGFGMILPIGAQNAFVLNRGILRNHHLTAAAVCIVCDVTLIGLGIYGGGELMSRNALLLRTITWGGIVFLIVYGALSLRTALSGATAAAGGEAATMRRWAVVAATLAVTLLNPHVYIDTVMILGSVGNQHQGTARTAFAAGTMLASLCWFLALALVAAKMSQWLGRPQVQRFIALLVTVIMWSVALALLLSLD